MSEVVDAEDAGNTREKRKPLRRGQVATSVEQGGLPAAANTAPSVPGAPISGFLPANYGEALEMARMIHLAKLGGRDSTPEGVCAIMMTGMDLGLKPMIALRCLYATQDNKVGIMNAGLAAVAQATGKLEYIDDEIVGEGDSMKCIVTIKRVDRPRAITREFSIDDAKLAGLNGKDNWKKYPKRMLFARAASTAYRDAFPERLGGFYTEDEGATPVGATQGMQDVTPPESADDDLARIESKAHDNADAEAGADAVPLDIPPGVQQEIAEGKYLNFLIWLTKLGAYDKTAFNTAISVHKGALAETRKINVQRAKDLVAEIDGLLES